MLRTDPPNPLHLPRGPSEYADTLPRGLSLQLFCRGGWHRTLDRQWGSVLRYLPQTEVLSWARTARAHLDVLRQYPTYTSVDMALVTRPLVSHLFFAILSGSGTCPCHASGTPPAH